MKSLDKSDNGGFLREKKDKLFCLIKKSKK